MDIHTDIHLIRGETSQDTLPENVPVDHKHESGNTVLNEDLIPESLSASNVHLNLVARSGDIEAREGQSSAHPFKPDQEHSDIQSMRDKINHEHGCSKPPCESNQIILPEISEEIPSSELPVVPACGSPLATNISNSEVPPTAYSQEPALLCQETASTATPRDERGEADPDDSLNCTQILPEELHLAHSTDLARLTDGEETREDIDYPCEDFPSSLPPSSSPPQLFSSSPCASSQSSASGGERSKMTLPDEVDGSTSSRNCLQPGHVSPAIQDESSLESEYLHGHTVDVPTSPKTDKHCSGLEGSPPSRKRVASQNDADESRGSQRTKRLKLDLPLYLPPAPMRATLASQNHQFKKLATPFRPPSKLPVARDDLVQAVTDRAAELASSSRPETDPGRPDVREPTTQASPLQHKASNTPRSVSQFRSPLVNKVLPADSRTIRLTPELQALERKLQLLKRAIKIKENDEEDVLVRLAEKWIEAGREVAYDVWGATKDAVEFEGKATPVRRSYGWESASDGNMSWGWDTKLGDAGEESCDPESSKASCMAGWLAPGEDDEDRFNNTLGTMLRRLGIAPEIFGWDDERECFSD